jgi:hypothetical protein
MLLRLALDTFGWVIQPVEPIVVIAADVSAA